MDHKTGLQPLIKFILSQYNWNLCLSCDCVQICDEMTLLHEFAIWPSPRDHSLTL